MHRTIHRLVLVGALSALPLTSFSQTQVVVPVPYMTGGIGQDERDALLQEAKQENYNLKIVTAATGGAYLASVTVRISDREGRQILQAALDGPWLFARLPPGQYTITADDGERSQKRTTQVPANGMREVMFRWQRADVGR